MGMSADEIRRRVAKKPKKFGVWECNWLAVSVFQAMSSQWHCSMNGREGLRYEVLPVIERRFGVKKDQKADLFYALRVMEGAALKVWAGQRVSS